MRPKTPYNYDPELAMMLCFHTRLLEFEAYKQSLLPAKVFDSSDALPSAQVYIDDEEIKIQQDNMLRALKEAIARNRLTDLETIELALTVAMSEDFLGDGVTGEEMSIVYKGLLSSLGISEQSGIE